VKAVRRIPGVYDGKDLWEKMIDGASADDDDELLCVVWIE